MSHNKRSGRSARGICPVLRLQEYLDLWSREGDAEQRRPVAAVVAGLAHAAADLGELISRGPLAGSLDAVVGDNADGDAQKELDVRANGLFLDAMREAPVAVYASEENEEPVPLHLQAPLAVAIDPLDGSSNIDTNLSIGTVIGVLPVRPEDRALGTPEAPFLQPGTGLLAAGFVIYGPQTALALTVRQGTHIFTLDRKSGTFWLTRESVRIPLAKREYAINASNYRHWELPIRTYIDDCIAGSEGPRGFDFNMRWAASLVAEAFRILARGGVFLYPRDARPGYRRGRLRLVYEANPLALLVEEAGGGATDGEHRILELKPTAVHERVPLVFGSRDKVERVAAYHNGQLPLGERSPLFGRRGLFRI
jgi:fructose-1,6-bisphosphatase I